MDLFLRDDRGAAFAHHELGADGEVEVASLGVHFRVAEAYERAGV